MKHSCSHSCPWIHEEQYKIPRVHRGTDQLRVLSRFGW